MRRPVRSSEISLVPLSNAKFKELRQHAEVHEAPGVSPYLGSQAAETAPKQSTVYTGHCERFDLSDDKARQEYAALSAKLLAGVEYIRLWEDKLQDSGGKLIAYVSYVRVLSVYSTGNDNFDLKDN